MKRIQFVFANPEHQEKMGIYILLVGDKWYLGRASNFRNRMYSHRNKSSNKHMFNYVRENAHIKSIEVLVVELCDSIEECVVSEQNWLKAIYHIGYHDHILNDFRLGNHPQTCWSKEALEFNRFMDTD